MSAISSEDAQALADARAKRLADEKKHKEDSARLASVQALIKKVVNDFNWPKAEREDAEQEITMALWKARDRWDSSKGASWSTFTVKVARDFLCDARKKLKRKILPDLKGDFSSHARPETDRGWIGDDEEEDDLEAVHESTSKDIAEIASGLMAELTPSQQLIFRMIAVEKLSVSQAAIRLDQKLSIVEISMRKIVRRLVESGKSPPELIETFNQLKEVETVKKADEAENKGRSAQDKRQAKKRGDVSGWSKTIDINQHFSCRKCDSKDVRYQKSQSAKGGLNYDYYCLCCHCEWSQNRDD